MQEGPAAIQALLAMLTACLQRADAHTVASQADAMWSFLLRALDTRQRMAGGAGTRSGVESVAAIEAAAVAALVAVVLKLSEARCKPLFLRLLDWASSPPRLCSR